MRLLGGNTEYLEIQDVPGRDSTVSTGDEGRDSTLVDPFDVSFYSLGSRGTVLQPLTVTLANGPLANTLAMDAQKRLDDHRGRDARHRE